MAEAGAGSGPPSQAEVSATWDKEADGWDTNAGVIAYSEQAYAQLLRLLGEVRLEVPLAGARVLDFGCGSGLLTDKLRGAGAHVVALDAAPKMVAVVEAKVRERGWTNVTPVHAIVDSATVASTPALSDPAKFDLIVASSVCMFVPDLPATLSALAAVLKPGALFVHFDWPGDSADTSAGFNAENAAALYAKAGLRPLRAETVEFSFPSEEETPQGEEPEEPGAGTVFAGVAVKA